MTVRSRLILAASLALILVAVVATVFIRRSGRLISSSSRAYEDVSRAFYHGYAALQVGLLDDAKTQFAKATEIAPREPASWANLGLTDLRLGELDPAAQAIDRAAQLARVEQRDRISPGTAGSRTWPSRRRNREIPARRGSRPSWIARALRAGAGN